MEPIEGSETSANYNRTPRKYPKEYIQYWQECFKATVTDNPGSKADQKYARRRDRQNYIRKSKYKFRDFEQKQFQVGTIYWYIGRVRTSRLLISLWQCLSPEGFGLFLDKCCDRIAALAPCKQKTFSEAFDTHQSDSCLCLTRDVVFKRAQAEIGDKSWLSLVRAS